MDNSKRVIICEGFATGATLHEATKQPVLCAMDTGNLKNVALAVREKYGDGVEIIIAGDNDHARDGNPGKKYAEEAAKACEGKAVIPTFTPQQKSNGYTDFNDLASADSKITVRQQITAALSKEHEKEGVAVTKKSKQELSYG